MKVLLASYWSQPHTGGIYSYIKALKAGLEAQGHEVDVLAYEPGRKHLYLLGRGRRVARRPIWAGVYRRVTAFYRRRLPRVTRRICNREAERYTLELAARYFDLAHYDIIHTQDAMSTRALSRVRPRGVGLVATIHGGLLAESLILGTATNPPDRRYLALEERLGLTSADVTLVPSAWMAGYFHSLHGIGTGALRVVPYGLDIPGFHRAAALPPGNLPPSGGRKVILCPARMSVVKGTDRLLSAIAILRRRRRDFVCWLAGSGPTQRRLMRQARELGLRESVVFLGTRQDVPALLSLSDIMVLPSLHDNLPYAVMEAQVAGKAVVATRVGGLPEMIQDGTTGLLVPTRNSAALAGALNQLLTNDAMRLQLGEAAQAWGHAHWDLNRMVQATLSAYQQAAAQEARRR